MSRQGYVCLLFFYVAACSVGVFGGWEEDVQNILNNGEQSNFLNQIFKLKNNFQAYNIDEDDAVPWRELKKSMDDLKSLRKETKDNSTWFFHYNGIDVSDLSEMCVTSDALMNKYRAVVKKMFEWAVMGKETMHLIFRRKDELKSVDRIKKFTEELLQSGSTTIGDTVDKLNGISDSLTDFKYTLIRKQADMRSELEWWGSRGRQCASWKDEIIVLMENLSTALDDGIRSTNSASLQLVQKVKSTKSAINAEIKYVEVLNGKAKELSERSHILPVDLFDLIFEDLDSFGSNLGKYVERHSGGNVMSFHSDDSSDDLVVARTAESSEEHTGAKLTLEEEFHQMKQKVNIYLSTTEINASGF